MEDHVPALLAAERIAAALQLLEHVPVADGGLDDLDPGFGHRQPEAEVRHHRDDDGVVAQQAPRAHVDRADGDHVVAVDDPTALVDGDQPVAVAVEGEAGEGTLLDDHASESGRLGGAALTVDVGAVRRGVDQQDLGAGPREDLTGDFEGGAVGGVDDDLHPAERASFDRGDDVLDVGGAIVDRPRVDDHAGLTGGLAPTPTARPRSARSTSSGSLLPLGENSLMPLSSYGLCDADTTAPMPPSRAAWYAIAGVGATPRRCTSKPFRRQTGDECRLEHRGRPARVATDDRARRAEHRERRRGRGRARTTG